jgi:hypothetical protein
MLEKIIEELISALSMVKRKGLKINEITLTLADGNVIKIS